MAQYRAKAKPCEAFTFEELVEHGLKAEGSNIVDGVPWSFTLSGLAITHETNDCYLIPTRHGTLRFNRGDMLVIDREVYPMSREDFDKHFESA